MAIAFRDALKNRRHYESLILSLQREMRNELRRLLAKAKEQDELVENLRDQIASKTVSGRSDSLLIFFLWARFLTHLEFSPFCF